MMKFLSSIFAQYKLVIILGAVILALIGSGVVYYKITESQKAALNRELGEVKLKNAIHEKTISYLQAENEKIAKTGRILNEAQARAEAELFDRMNQIDILDLLAESIKDPVEAERKLNEDYKQSLDALRTFTSPSSLHNNK